MSLKGKVALVTGSTSGIGLGIATALAEAGADLLLNGFGEASEIETLRARLAEQFGVRVVHCASDMAKPEQIREMVVQSVDRLGSLDILVNNAGVQFVAPIQDFPEQQWDRIIAVNLSAPFHASKAAIAVMRSRGWGRIINIASAHGLVGSSSKAAYVAAKHGVVGLTKVAAIELANDGITVNAICPGWVLTPLVEAQLEARARDEGCAEEAVIQSFLAEKQPMTQFTTPAQVGAMAVFLCSEAASTMTGAALPVDGGWTAR